MKKLAFCFSVLILILVGCKKESDNINTNQDLMTINQNSNLATNNDFEETTNLDRVLEIPFQVFAKNDSLTLYTKPDKISKYKIIYNDKLISFNGFDELDDFYILHYQFQEDSKKTYIVYALKNELIKDSQLALNNIDLNAIKNIDAKKSLNSKLSSFSPYGNVTLITKDVYLQGRNKISDGLIVKNPKMKFDGSTWQMESYDGPFVVQKITRSDDEKIENEYLGYCAKINREIFTEKDEITGISYYVALDPYEKEKEKVYFDDYPIILPTEQKIATISSQANEGTDFEVIKYDSKLNEFNTELKVNFVNFKIVDPKKMFWVTNKTLYLQAVNSNSNTDDGDYKIEYLKIELK